MFSEYVTEKDKGERHAEGNIKKDLEKNRTKNVYQIKSPLWVLTEGFRGHRNTCMGYTEVEMSNNFGK